MNGIADEIIAKNQDAVLGLGGRPDGDAEREQDHPRMAAGGPVPWTNTPFPPRFNDSTRCLGRVSFCPPPLHSVRGHAAVGALEPDITACTLPDPPPLLPRAHEGAQPLCGSCASAGPRTVLVQHVRPLWPRRKHSVTHTRRHVLGRFAAHEARPALFALHGA